MTAPDYTELRERLKRLASHFTSATGRLTADYGEIVGDGFQMMTMYPDPEGLAADLARLPEASTAIAELQAQVAAKDAENAVMGGALTRISVGQPMTMMDGTTLMVCLPGTASQEIANAALAKVKRAALGQGEG